MLRAWQVFGSHRQVYRCAFSLFVCPGVRDGPALVFHQGAPLLPFGLVRLSVTSRLTYATLLVSQFYWLALQLTTHYNLCPLVVIITII